MKKNLLRIAFVIDDLGYGGAQRQLSTICPGFKGSAEPRVYCLSERIDPFAAVLSNQDISVTTFRRRGNIDPGRLNALTRRLAADKVDVVHGFLDASNIYASLAARRNHLPCVLSLRAQTHFIGGLKKRFLCHLLRRTERVVANSRAGTRYLADRVGVSPEQIVFVPNAIGPVSGKPPTVGGPPTVGFVGRLVPLKRVDMLIDAFALLVRRIPEAHLVIVGNGPEREHLESLAGRLAIQNRVEFTGNVRDVASRMGDLDCLVLPSESEGFPNVAMEAIASGLPVIASPAGDIREIVKDGETGYLLADASPEALCGLIERVLLDDKLRASVSEHGRSFIASRYSVKKAVEILMGVYTEIADVG